jgi:hypothetical protein
VPELFSAAYKEAVMDLPDLGLVFYGATIDQARVGPRRELALDFSDMAGNPYARVRFGGITNFDEVKAFFQTPPADGLHFLRYDPAEASKPGRLVVELGFDRSEERCVVCCSNAAVSIEVEPRFSVLKDGV